MENATKALIMAGGVLISIMVLSFLVLMFRKGGQMSASYDIQLSENELAKFNTQFEIYQKDDNNFFDVITAVNLAWDINKKNGDDLNNSVVVYVKKDDHFKFGLWKDGNGKSQVFLKENLMEKPINIYDLINSKVEGCGDKTYGGTKLSTDGEVTYEFKYTGTDIKYNEITGKVNSITFLME